MPAWLVCLVATLALAAGDSVPVLAWSSEKITVPGELLKSGHGVSVNAFMSAFPDQVLQESNVLVLFIQDKLSLTDITVYGANQNSLSSVKALYENAASSFAFSAVVSENGKVANTIMTKVMAAATTAKSTPFFLTAAGITSFDFSALRSLSVVVVELPAVASAPSLAAALAENDAIIGSFMENAARHAKGSVSAILTTRNSDAAQHSVVMRRQAQAGFVPQSTAFVADSFPLPLTKTPTKSYMYFTIPLFMGVIVFMIILLVVLMGITGVSWTKTPQRWADTTDKCLQVAEE